MVRRRGPALGAEQNPKLFLKLLFSRLRLFKHGCSIVKLESAYIFDLRGDENIRLSMPHLFIDNAVLHHLDRVEQDFKVTDIAGFGFTAHSTYVDTNDDVAVVE